MPKIRKLVIGVRPAKKIFRLTSQVGLVLDRIVDAVGDTFPDDYVKLVQKTPDEHHASLISEDGSTALTLNLENILLAKDYYDSHNHCDINKILSEFNSVWSIINSILKLRDIRRIGIYAEYRFQPGKDNASAELLSLFTNLNRDGVLAKANLSFECRHLAKKEEKLDIKKSDFINIIENYYDSELDTEHSAKGVINANIDVQRYFSPLLNSGVESELAKLSREFDKASGDFFDRLKKLGLSDAKW